MVIGTNGSIKKRIAVFLLVFPFIMPVSIPYLSSLLDLAYDCMKLIGFVIVIFLFIKSGKIKWNSIIYLFLFELWLSFTSFINNSQTTRGVFVSLLSAVSLPFIIDYFSDDMDNLVPALLFNYEWMIYVNLMTIILYFPNGLYDSASSALKPRPSYFLGNENGIIFYAIPAIALALFNVKLHGSKRRAWCIIIASLMGIIITWSATSIVGIAVGALIIILYNINFKKFINFWSVTLVLLAVDLAVSVFRIVDKNGMIASFITNVLKKTVTLSGRTFIWDEFHRTISGNWLLGFGRGNHVFYLGSYEHCHNEWFQILIEGGIPGLVLFSLFIVSIGHNLKKNMNVDSFIVSVALGMIACLFVQFIATARVSILVYVPLVLSCYVHKINTQSKSERIVSYLGIRRRSNGK